MNKIQIFINKLYSRNFYKVADALKKIAMRGDELYFKDGSMSDSFDANHRFEDLHREDGPAMIYKGLNNQTIKTYWYLDGVELDKFNSIQFEKYLRLTGGDLANCLLSSDSFIRKSAEDYLKDKP